MSLLLKAFPHGRPSPRLPVQGTAVTPALALVLVTVLALVAVLLPLAESAEAKPKPRSHRHARAHAVPKVIGQPHRNYVIPAGSYFSFPNRSKLERQAIRKRLLFTIQSTWGGRRNSLGGPLPANGRIRIATWSFDDWGIAKALVAARNRGVSVQIVGAKSANRGIASWRWLRKKLGSKLYRRGYPVTAGMHSFARQCRGSCRGPGGTPHSKFFLFDNVGAAHKRNVVVQSSANLTEMAYDGQWNQAQAMYSVLANRDFAAIFRQMALRRRVPQPYHVKLMGPVTNYFFPRPRATPAMDPVIHNLNAVSCRGATTGSGSGRTMIRIIQYAMYADRGVWIAKKLRYLWEAGCDIAIIYSVISRPVLSILRRSSGRGPVPMRQSVVKDPWGNLVKYNHSKWMTITGNWHHSTASYMTFSGSANWADPAFGGDEQMQRILNRTIALRHLGAFAKTWRQRTSRAPGSGRVQSFGRTVGVPTSDIPEDLPEEPVFGEGIYRYLPED